jgi:hypothetical protein
LNASEPAETAGFVFCGHTQRQNQKLYHGFHGCSRITRIDPKDNETVIKSVESVSIGVIRGKAFDLRRRSGCTALLEALAAEDWASLTGFERDGRVFAAAGAGGAGLDLLIIRRGI